MKYKWVGNKKLYENLNQVILANCNNGKWIRFSKEVYDVMNCMVSTYIDSDKLEFEECDDKTFFINLVKELQEMDILLELNHEEYVQNKMVSIELTHRCNLNCIHCCIDAGDSSQNISEIDGDSIINSIKKIIEWNPKSIMLSGGEPLIRDDFFEIAHFLRVNYNGHIMLETNGLLITKANVDMLCELVNQIDISLDGYDEETCSKIRGKGVFNEVCSKVLLLQTRGFKNITLSIVTADKNEAWENSFAKLNEKLGTRPLYRLFSPVGRGARSVDFFSGKTEDEIYIPEKYLKKQNEDSVCSCSAGKRELFIDYKGDIYPCPTYIGDKLLLGNILSCSNLDAVTKIRDSMDIVIDCLDKNGIKDRRCKKCPVRGFCWTCPSSAEQIKTVKAFEAQCDLLFPILMKRIWGI